MASHTGPTKGALLLLCCMGTLLSVYTASICGRNDLRRIIIELKASSKRLLEKCKETGLPTTPTPYLPRPFAFDCQPPHYINSSVVLPYFRAIKGATCLCGDKMDIDDIIQQLEKPQFPRGPETELSLPTNRAFKCKTFIWAILQEFSTCVNRVVTDTGPRRPSSGACSS